MQHNCGVNCNVNMHVHISFSAAAVEMGPSVLTISLVL